MYPMIRIGLSCGLALSLALSAEAEEREASRGYYYPGMPFYGGYGPYGYRTPGYPGATQRSPAPAAGSPVTEKGLATTEVRAAAREPEGQTSGEGKYPNLSEQDSGALPVAFGSGSGRLGRVLASREGRTLYVALEDPAAEPQCEGGCPRLWRPYLMQDSDVPQAPFGAVQREDGSRQWSCSGRPLFLWLGDEATGDVTGDGVDGTWYAVRLARTSLSPD